MIRADAIPCLLHVTRGLMLGAGNEGGRITGQGCIVSRKPVSGGW
jgi:hypothetical protein